MVDILTAESAECLTAGNAEILTAEIAAVNFLSASSAVCLPTASSAVNLKRYEFFGLKCCRIFRLRCRICIIRLRNGIAQNHPFVDGNKRIGATLFLWFLEKNGILYRDDGARRISEEALVALTLLIAESPPSEMETVITLTVTLLSSKRYRERD